MFVSLVGKKPNLGKTNVSTPKKMPKVAEWWEKMKVFKPEGQLISTEENKRYLSNSFTLRDAFYAKAVIEGRVTRCDSEHNLYVDLGEVKGIIPRNEGALGIDDGSVRDIALISRVNKPVGVVITGFQTLDNGECVAMLSRKKVQQDCLDNYICNLRSGDVIPAVVSHMEIFGAFCDIGAGITALMPIDSISVSRIPHPNTRFVPGQSVIAVVRGINDDGRITLSHKELLGTWQQNAELFNIGETVPGIIRSVEQYGIFVELTPNLTGLADLVPGIEIGSHAGVYIKSIIPSRMKIKLVIVDSFEADYPIKAPEYFIKSGHIDSWTYSPRGSDRIIETVF